MSQNATCLNSKQTSLRHLLLYFLYMEWACGKMAISYKEAPIDDAAAFIHYFLPRDAMPARYMPWSCVCLSVCPSVCLSVCVCLPQVGVLLKWLNIGTCKQHTRQPRDSSFLSLKFFSKFERGHPQRGRQMEVGQGKVGEFRQITRRMSKTVQNRRIVSIKVEQEVVCALSNGDISDDLE